MKKHAFILMTEESNTAVNKAMFPTNQTIYYIYTVNSFQEARELVDELYSQGIGAIEFCGAFKKKFIDEMIQRTDNNICFGYTIQNDEQCDVCNKFYKR